MRLKYVSECCQSRGHRMVLKNTFATANIITQLANTYLLLLTHSKYLEGTLSTTEFE